MAVLPSLIARIGWGITRVAQAKLRPVLLFTLYHLLFTKKGTRSSVG